MSRVRRPPGLALGLALGAALFAATALPAAPPGQDAGRLVIGSKNFTESRVLGEMLTLLAEAHTDLAVEHRSGLGGTLVCFSALRNGEIDVYPEYTGTGWSVVLEESARVDDPLRAFLHVQAEYRRRFDIEWLRPIGINNTYALALREDRAEALGISTISDLAAHAPDLRAGFSIEFMNRPDGWPGLEPFYGLDLGQVRTLEHGLAYEAVAAGAIDVVDAYATDGKLPRYALRVLDDDRGFFPPYHAAPIVRRDTLATYPDLAGVLDRLAFRLDDETMIGLNYAVEEDGRDFRAVAIEYLSAEGLIGSDAGASARPDRGGGLVRFVASRTAETLRLGWEHIQLTALAVVLALAVAVPLGLGLVRSGAGERLVLGAAGVVQTIPSLALLAFMIAVPGLGLSVRSAVVALFLYAVLPILRNTVTGLRTVDGELVDAARGIGLTETQILLRVRLPIATPTIMAGVRTAAVISIGVATLAAFIGAGGLGEPIVTGLYLNDTRLILSGAVPAALLALAADYGLGRIEHRLTPRGLQS